MAECEVCGRNVVRTRRSEIDGVVLEVCDECADLGEEREEPKKLYVHKRIDYGELEEAKDFAGDFASRIRRARERRKLTQGEAAMKMGISHQLYKRIEGGLKPDGATAKKIERFFGVELYRTV